MVGYRGSPPATSAAPREASEPKPEPACGQEEAAGPGGQWQGGCKGGGYANTAAHPSHGIPSLSPGHLTLPEGSNAEKDCALRHGQLGPAESGPVLPQALQMPGLCAGDLWLHIWLACTSYLGPTPPGSCVCLRARAEAVGPAVGAPTVPELAGPRVLFIAFLSLLRCGTRAPQNCYR